MHYTVTEETPDGMTATWTGETGEITTDGATAACKNTRDTGSLEVTKNLFVDGKNLIALFLYERWLASRK